MKSYKQQYNSYIKSLKTSVSEKKKNKSKLKSKKEFNLSNVSTLPKQGNSQIISLVSFIDKLVKRTQCCRNNIKLTIKKKKQDEYNPIIKQLEELEKELANTESKVKVSTNKKEDIDENRILLELLLSINSYNENIKKLMEANNSVYQVSYNKKSKCNEQIEDCVTNLFIDLHDEFERISYLPLPTKGEYQNYLPEIVSKMKM